MSRAIEHTRRAFFEGEISRPEAANRTLVETAISVFLGQKVLVTTTEGRRKTVRLAPEYEGERLDALISEIAAFL